MMIGFVVKPNSVLAPVLLEEMIIEARLRGARVCVEKQSSKYYYVASKYTDCVFSMKEAELPGKIVVIGGDGTILKLSNQLEDRELPVVMGIRIGRRGFLLDVEPYEAKERFRDFLNEKYSIRKIYRLKTIMPRKDNIPLALNEVVIQSSSGKVLKLNIHVEEDLVYSMESDGVIISTTAGSTAYSLSAGGPIIDPSLNAFVITPLNPIQLHARPVVVPIEKNISIEICPRQSSYSYIVDGQFIMNLNDPVKIKLIKSRHPFLLAQFHARDYYSKLFIKTLGYM